MWERDTIILCRARSGCATQDLQCPRGSKDIAEIPRKNSKNHFLHLPHPSLAQALRIDGIETDLTGPVDLGVLLPKLPKAVLRGVVPAFSGAM